MGMIKHNFVGYAVDISFQGCVSLKTYNASTFIRSEFLHKKGFNKKYKILRADMSSFLKDLKSLDDKGRIKILKITIYKKGSEELEYNDPGYKFDISSIGNMSTDIDFLIDESNNNKLLCIAATLDSIYTLHTIMMNL